MKIQKTALIGLILPVLPVIAYVFLVLVVLLNNMVGSIIAADKLILLTIGLSAVIFVSGAVVSIIALFKSEMKTASLIGVALNIALLTVWVCFAPLFLAEFKLAI